MSDPILDQLNDDQRKAVTQTEGPVLVIAGAGSGKTRVITHRIAYLVRHQNVPSWRIFASTFTNKAAEEMKSRITHLLPGFETARLSIGTFHSICVSILRREAAHVGLGPRFTIADESDRLALVKDCLKNLEIPSSMAQPKEVIQRISAAKTEMYSPDDARRNWGAEWGEACIRVYELYEDRLQKNNAVDFDDLLLKTVRLFQDQPEVLALYQERWKYYLIDEYQDINAVQYEFVRLMAEKDRNLCVVGDEDQSIYSWRGARIENILQFSENFPGTSIIRLEQNYRSTKTILDAANTVIARNTMRHGKNLWSERGQGEPITLITGMNEREEAALVVETIRWLRRLFGTRYQDVAIFYRVNALSRLYEDFLRQAQIPYRVIGGIRFYDRAEIKDLMSYLRLIVNPDDEIGLMRIINRPRRGIGEKTLRILQAESTARGVSLWAALAVAVKEKLVGKKAMAGMADLIARVNHWREMSRDHTPSQLLDEVLHDTRYEDSLGDPHLIETLSRKENIEELRRAVEDFEAEFPDGALDEYLDRVSLAQAIDEMSDEDDCVSLMTLHGAKGLEFHTVFMTGLEESIFPNPRSVDDASSFEEERRLFYVGVTRARDRLFISRADSRSLYGHTQYNPPSSFLIEVPEELTRPLESAHRAWEERHREAASERASDAPLDAPRLADPGGTSIAVESRIGLFPVGSRVRHATLGEGEVVAVKGSGAKRKVSIHFDAGVQLEVLEQYGGLQLVEDMPF